MNTVGVLIIIIVILVIILILAHYFRPKSKKKLYNCVIGMNNFIFEKKNQKLTLKSNIIRLNVSFSILI